MEGLSTAAMVIDILQFFQMNNCLFSECQINIDSTGLECNKCGTNGAGNCDSDGCPTKTTYHETSRRCQSMYPYTNHSYEIKG